MGIIRDSFIIVKNWAEAIEALPEENQLETYKALVQYGITGKIPEGTSKICNAMLISFSKEMEYNIARYNASVENGKKGGRPSKNKQEIEETQENLDEPSKNLEKLSKTQNNPDITQDNPDITLYDNDNVYVYVNKLVKENKNNKLLNISARAHTREEIFDYLKEKYFALFSYYPSYNLEIEEILNELCNLIESALNGDFRFNKLNYSLEELCSIVEAVKVSELPGLVNSIIYNKSIENKQLYIFGAILNIAIKKYKRG